MSLMLETEVREAAPGITVVKFSGRITTGPESADIEVLARKLVWSKNSCGAAVVFE
jgi:hypothetical protein